MIVGIYKIPAIWSKQWKNVKDFPNPSNPPTHIQKDDISSFKEHQARITNIQNNIYFELFQKMILHFNAKDAHYIFVDESLEQPIKSTINNIAIWILTNHQDLCYFRKADIYFLRGNYLRYYDNFIQHNPSKLIFYPATSLIFKYKKDNTILKENDIFKLNEVTKFYQDRIDHLFYKKVTHALIHEDNIYKELFAYSKQIIFHKQASKAFYYLDLERIYDFIFIGDATQLTKNHDLFFNFIQYCDNNHLPLNILYISDRTILKDNIPNFIDPLSLKSVTLTYKNYLTPEELNIEMNKSKINLTFSGRDASPRTISETLAAGCYNVALDTLTDGKSYYNKVFGELVGESSLPLQVKRRKSVSYISHDKLWKPILNLLNKTIQHEYISKRSKKMFNDEFIITQLD
jgi:hypothetical protein